MTASADADDEAEEEIRRQGDGETRGQGETEGTVEVKEDLAESGGRDVRAPVETRAPGIEEFDRNELIAAIRDVFEASAELEREAATREVARKLGFARTGPRIAEAIDSALIAAVKRGVIKNERGWLSLDCRRIEDYPRELLVEMLLASMGRGWTERDEAIVAAARHLGFRRTGSAIKERFKSIINGAIRRGALEYDGSQIRKTTAS